MGSFPFWYFSSFPGLLESPNRYVSPDLRQIQMIAAEPGDTEPIHDQWDLTDEEYVWGLGTPEARDKFDKSMGWLGLSKMMTTPSRYYMEGKSVPFQWIFYEEIKQYLLGEMSHADMGSRHLRAVMGAHWRGRWCVKPGCIGGLGPKDLGASALTREAKVGVARAIDMARLTRGGRW